MKTFKHFTSLVFIAILLFTGCEKEPLHEEVLEKTKVEDYSYLTLTQDEYNTLKAEITKTFENTTSLEKQNSMDWENVIPNSINIKSLENISSENTIYEIIEKNEDVISNFPELIGHTSMLTVYNEALRIKDEVELKNYIEKYSYFLTYIKEFNSVMLTVPAYKAALLNPDGLIKIDNNIIKYTNDAIKIIKNGDVGLINNLSKVNTSTDEIEVLILKTIPSYNKTRDKSISTTRFLGSSWPQNLFAVTVVKFVDSEPYTHKIKDFYFNPQTNQFEDLITFAVRYSAGAECYSWFNSSFISSKIGLAVLTSYNLGPVSTDYVFTNSSVSVSKSRNYNDFANNEGIPQSFLNIDLFSVVSSWNVVYVNGTVFNGNW